MSEWFEDWFSSAEYLTVYKHRDDTDAQKLTDLICKTIKPANISTVLDLACGTGRHSILLAEKGFSVTGVDLNENLLNIGIEKSKELGLKIDFLAGDLRNFSNINRFSLVINLFTSFGYFINDADNFNIFKIAYNHLNPNGYFVFDYFNSSFLIKNLNKYSIDIIDDLQITQKREIVDSRVVKEINIKGKKEKKKFFESVKLYESHIIVSNLENLGFKIEKTMGDYSGEIFDKNKSKRLIIFAKR